MVVCIDCSKSTSETDYKPTRLDAVKSIMKAFISEYYDQNPISQCCIAISRDRKAEKISDLSGNIKSHFSALDNLNRCDGLPSLQHMLKVASITLRHVPEYGCKELLIIYGSLSTCDPGDIFETLEVSSFCSVSNI
jgi:transcription initiation factor TFIIH subunit 2